MAIKRSDDELKHEIYAVLFSAGERMLLDDIAKYVKCRDRDRVEKLLVELEHDLEQDSGPVFLMKDGAEYKLQVRTKFLDIVQKVCKLTELPKSMLETLAVVAYKSPVLQSDVVRIRTNKAYEHLAELEKQGFLTREPHGRSQLVRVSQKFFDYFEISPEELQKQIAKRQIKEEGEQQQKITTMMDKAGELEVYKEGESLMSDVEVYRSNEEVTDSDSSKNQMSSQDSGIFDDKSNSSQADDGSLFIEDGMNDSVATTQDADTESDSSSQEDRASQTTANDKTSNEPQSDRSPKESQSTHGGESKQSEKEAEDKEEAEYEPLKVKGGFKEFSSEEKHKIKERTEEIKGEDDDDEQEY